MDRQKKYLHPKKDAHDKHKASETKQIVFPQSAHQKLLQLTSMFIHLQEKLKGLLTTNTSHAKATSSSFQVINRLASDTC